jgi:dihydrofolate reductase
MVRARCSVFLATSVDGYIARRDGALDWLERFHGHDHGYAAFFASIDTIVVGRGTYDTVLGFGEWPYHGKRVVVMTHRPGVADHDERFTSEPPHEVVAGLSRDGARRIYVDGGNVIRQFLAAGLIDDLTISVVPIVLGAGIRLFAGDEGEHALVLDSSESWPNGLVQLRYRLPAPS